MAKAKATKTTKTAKQTIEKKTASKTTVKSSINKAFTTIELRLNYTTKFGENIFVTGNTKSLGNNNTSKALPLQYINESTWGTSFLASAQELDTTINYQYFVTNNKGINTYEYGFKTIDLNIAAHQSQLICHDSWNAANYNTQVYNSQLAKIIKPAVYNQTIKPEKQANHTVHFFVQCPNLPQHLTVCLIGSTSYLNNWNTATPILMQHKAQGLFYTSIALHHASNIEYKYGLYNTQTLEFIEFEKGDNRHIYYQENTVIINDCLVNIDYNLFKTAGVAIPVFSLKTENSFGVGDFLDIIPFANWCKKTGINIIQLLPINDTNNTGTWTDSYPYSAISAFALHPIYINAQHLSKHRNYKAFVKKITPNALLLNSKTELDYEAVFNIKINLLQKAYELDFESLQENEDYKNFVNNNKDWLFTYAAFCYCRDTFNTTNFTQWKAYKKYNAAQINQFFDIEHKAYHTVNFYLFTQYQLHTQLKQAKHYAAQQGIAIKGDLPIGINRFSADVWQYPNYFNVNMQAGAPPDAFSAHGQNWGFPTYHWKNMAKHNYSWFINRFNHLSQYFDAIRIDHVLGFFRIWSIPSYTTNGCLGYFVPAQGITLESLQQEVEHFDLNRLTQPYVTKNIIQDIFKQEAETIIDTYFEENANNEYICLKQTLNTEVKLNNYWKKSKASVNELTKQTLLNLLSNVILIADENNKNEFHFRIDVNNTDSFKALSLYNKRKIEQLYHLYFGNWQEQLWYKEGYEKLGILRKHTNMLICGEDLGMVPNCVPAALSQLGILSLNIQRMPKNTNGLFYNLTTAHYLNVVSPSTHDMSTIRQWWKENKEATQHFYTNLLNKNEETPAEATHQICSSIIFQHLHSPAMLAIFQLQDLLSINAVRKSDDNNERINNPANAHHNWNYRMHLSIEQLLAADDFNTQLKNLITDSERL